MIVAVARAERKNLAQPDERVDLPGIEQELVDVGGMSVSRTVQAPGWRWSTDVRPLVGGDWCQARHVGVVISGRFGVAFEDGSTLELGPGDVYDIPPGHDGYTIGDEAMVSIEWSGMRALAGARAQFQDRMLTTLLFTDVVGSTATALEIGDAAWRELLGVHQQGARGQIERYAGRYVEHTGDGLLATFDAPARAIRCAEAIRVAANRSGLTLRAGIHVGEVALEGNAVRGLAVHEAARIMAAAAPDEILVCDTTRALAQAAGLAFRDRGERELKGLPGARRLWAYEA